jgi:hypothetical protein
MRGKTTKVLCAHCGNEFIALLIKIRAGKSKYCSNKCYNEFRKLHRRNTKQSDIYYQKKHKYGLTKEEYLGLFEKQNYKCAICETSLKDKRAMVDHCHGTGKVRGLLCNNCNTLLGMADDDIIKLERAIDYLLR